MANNVSNLETHLAAAIEIGDQAEREAYLRGACEGDSGRLAELQGMVHDYFAASSLFDRPAVLAPTLDAGGQPEVGTWVGPYKLRELLGEGGMGSVYVAEQEKPVRRKVALKVIKPGMDSRQVIARFEAERQALAIMEHTNIARVLDAGTTQGGRPYFVMELVRGLPITEHCDSAELDTRQRLELFLQVCRAVQHAHQKGVIHRDLKPSNVLVAMNDAEPVVKVIDFGIAKAIGQQLSDNTFYTAFSQMVGTPLYMSPEQAGHSNLDIDTRSDIYSLGVLLYELLTGDTPFDRETLKQAGFDEMRRMIREIEPPKPSVRVSTLKAANQSTIAQQHRVEPAKFSQLLRGELDWIVMKAMDKDRNRRYETTNAFASDIQRYLNDEPVQACPPTWRYRFGKALRRHRIATVFVSAVFISLSAGLSVAYWQLQRALLAESHTADALTRVSEQSQISARRLTIALDAVDDMYVQVASKWLAQQSDQSNMQREFLEKAVLTYEKLSESGGANDTTQLRSVSAAVRLGQLHQSLGRSEKAIEVLSKAIQLAREIADREPSASASLVLADTQSQVAKLNLAKRQLADSIRFADQAYSNLRTIDLDELKSLNDKAFFIQCLLKNALDFATIEDRKIEAKQAAERCVFEAERLSKQFPSDNNLRLLLARGYDALGEQRLWWGEQNEECMTAYQACISILDELGKQGSSKTSTLAASSTPLINLCVVLKRLGRHSEVPSIRAKHIANLEELCVLKPDVLTYKAELAMSLVALSGEFEELGNAIEAIEARQRAREILTTVADKFPDQHRFVRDLVMLLTRIGSKNTDSEDDVMAIEALTEASERYRRFEKANPNDFDFYIIGLNLTAELAPAYLRVGNYRAAAESLEAIAGTFARLTAARETASEKYTLRELSAIVLYQTILSNLYEYCQEAAETDESIPVEQRQQVVDSFRSNVLSAKAIRSRFLVDWGTSIAESNVPLEELDRRLRTNVDQIFDSLVDTKSFHLFASLEKSLDFAIENSIVERNVLLIKEYAASIESSLQLPQDWCNVAMIVASASELNIAPKTFLKFCELAIAQDRESVPAQQALGWALYRNAMWKECIRILESEALRQEPCNLYVLAMAKYQLGDKVQAYQAWQEAELLTESQQKSAKSDPSKFADINKIKRVALPRLQWEATTLLEVEVEAQTEK